MIDFTNSTIVKLKPSQPGEDVISMLVDGEQVFRSFQGVRDSVHFTSKRIICTNVQGITGRKTDYSSLVSQGSGMVRRDSRNVRS